MHVTYYVQRRSFQRLYYPIELLTYNHSETIWVESRSNMLILKALGLVLLPHDR